MKVIVMSDAHIKELLWSSMPSVTGDADKAVSRFEQLADRLTRENHWEKPVLLCTGDITDAAKVSPSDVRNVLRICGACRTVLYVQGNHDRYDPYILYSVPNAIAMDQFGYKLNDNTLVFGVDYTNDKDSLHRLLEDIHRQQDPTKQTVILMHQAFQHLFGRNPDLTAADIYNTMPDAKVFVGHIHSINTLYFSTLAAVGSQATGFIRSTGPMLPQEWPETLLPCGVDVVDTDTWTIEHQQLVDRKFYIVDVTTADVHAVLHDINQQYPDAAVQVRVPIGTSPIDYTSYENIHIQEYPVKGPETAQEDLVSLQEGLSIEDAIRQEYDDPADGEMLWQLYKSPDPKGLLDKTLQDCKVTRK